MVACKHGSTANCDGKGRIADPKPIQTRRALERPQILVGVLLGDTFYLTLK